MKQVGMQQAVEAFRTVYRNHLEKLLLRECTRIISELPANYESDDSSLKFCVVRLYSQTFKAFIAKTTSEPHNPQIRAEMLQQQT